VSVHFAQLLILEFLKEAGDSKPNKSFCSHHQRFLREGKSYLSDALQGVVPDGHNHSDC